MRKKSKIIYDSESGALLIQVKDAKGVDSDVQGNVVVDYDRGGHIVRISLYDFHFGAFRDTVKQLKEFARHAAVSVLAR